MPFRRIVRCRLDRGTEESQDVRLPPTSLDGAFDNGIPEMSRFLPNTSRTHCDPKL
jgi:hypothetical protein